MFKLTGRSRRHLVAIRDEGPCSVRPMTVDVRRHLGLNDVLVPRVFESFRCGGECKFPLDTSVSIFLLSAKYYKLSFLEHTCLARNKATVSLQ